MKQSLSSNTVTWHILGDPETDELAEFVRDANVLPLDAEFLVQDRRRPEIAIRDSYILILMNVPVFDKQARVTSAAPLYLLITEGTLWTLTYEPVPVLEKLIQEYVDSVDKREEYFGERAIDLAIHLIDRMYASAFRKLERLGKHISIAEDAVFHGNERKMVEEVALLSRDVMDFRKAIRPQRFLFDHPPQHALIDLEVRSLWQRLNNTVERLWDMLDGLSEGVKQLTETNNALLQHKENQLLRTLTFYSILAIPALVLVDPFFVSTSPEAGLLEDIVFWVVFGGLVIGMLLMFLRLKRRRTL